MALPPAHRYVEADIASAAQAGQWVLHYQPKVELGRGALTGVEAPVRWNHPLHGLVYPDRFIELAEGCGVTDVLTNRVLRAAMTYLSAGHQQGLRPHMSVNVSMDNLGMPGFAHQLGAMADAARVAPADLTLEVTESRMMFPGTGTA